MAKKISAAEAARRKAQSTRTKEAASKLPASSAASASAKGTRVGFQNGGGKQASTKKG